MSDLRSRVIRLAHANPALRPHLLPLLKRAAGPGDAVLSKALDNLADLAELSANAQEIIDGFNLHYASGRVAGLDPQIASEHQILRKVTEGKKLADQTVKAMKNLVKLFPEETKYAKALADAQKMLDKLTKQVDSSKKIIRTIAQKVAPKALTDFSKKIKTKIKSKLLDSSQIETYFTQGADYQSPFESFFVVNALVGGTELRPTALWIKELVTGTPGLSMSVAFDGGFPQYYSWKPATLDGAIEMFFENVKGWKNVKGEAEGASARKGTAEAVARAIRRTLSGMVEDPEISSDARTIEGAYRSNLPREGAYDVGEYEYEEMVQDEIARYRKKLDPALAPFKSQIANVSVHDGEKSWIYVTVTLK
jgi:hypothetical protein